MAQQAQTRATVIIAPPAWAVRQQAGLGVPGARGFFQAVTGTIAGAGAAAIFIGALGEPNARFVGALITGAIGAYFAAVSPVATIPHEIGLGMTCTSFSHLYYSLAKQYK